MYRQKKRFIQTRQKDTKRFGIPGLTYTLAQVTNISVTEQIVKEKDLQISKTLNIKFDTSSVGLARLKN